MVVFTSSDEECRRVDLAFVEDCMNTDEKEVGEGGYEVGVGVYGRHLVCWCKPDTRSGAFL